MNVAALLQDSPSDDHRRRQEIRERERERDREREQREKERDWENGAERDTSTRERNSDSAHQRQQQPQPLHSPSHSPSTSSRPGYGSQFSSSELNPRARARERGERDYRDDGQGPSPSPSGGASLANNSSRGYMLTIGPGVAPGSSTHPPHPQHASPPASASNPEQNSIYLTSPLSGPPRERDREGPSSGPGHLQIGGPGQAPKGMNVDGPTTASEYERSRMNSSARGSTSTTGNAKTSPLYPTPTDPVPIPERDRERERSRAMAMGGSASRPRSPSSSTYSDYSQHIHGAGSSTSTTGQQPHTHHASRSPVIRPSQQHVSPPAVPATSSSRMHSPIQHKSPNVHHHNHPGGPQSAPLPPSGPFTNQPSTRRSTTNLSPPHPLTTTPLTSPMRMQMQAQAMQQSSPAMGSLRPYEGGPTNEVHPPYTVRSVPFFLSPFPPSCNFYFISYFLDISASSRWRYVHERGWFLCYVIITCRLRHLIRFTDLPDMDNQVRGAVSAKERERDLQRRDRERDMDMDTTDGGAPSAEREREGASSNGGPGHVQHLHHHASVPHQRAQASQYDTRPLQRREPAESLAQHAQRQRRHHSNPRGIEQAPGPLQLHPSTSTTSSSSSAPAASSGTREKDTERESERERERNAKAAAAAAATTRQGVLTLAPPGVEVRNNPPHSILSAAALAAANLTARGKEREGIRERDAGRDMAAEMERERDIRDRERDMAREREREREFIARERERERDGMTRERDRERERERDRERQRERENVFVKTEMVNPPPTSVSGPGQSYKRDPRDSPPEHPSSSKSGGYMTAGMGMQHQPPPPPSPPPYAHAQIQLHPHAHQHPHPNQHPSLSHSGKQQYSHPSTKSLRVLPIGPGGPTPTPSSSSSLPPPPSGPPLHSRDGPKMGPGTGPPPPPSSSGTQGGQFGHHTHSHRQNSGGMTSQPPQVSLPMSSTVGLEGGMPPLPPHPQQHPHSSQSHGYVPHGHGHGHSSNAYRRDASPLPQHIQPPGPMVSQNSSSSSHSHPGQAFPPPPPNGASSMHYQPHPHSHPPPPSQQLSDALVPVPLSLPLPPTSPVPNLVPPPPPPPALPPFNLGTYVFPRSPFPYFFPSRARSSDGDRPAGGKKARQEKEKQKENKDDEAVGERETHVTIFIPSSYLPLHPPKNGRARIWGGGLPPTPPPHDPLSFSYNRYGQPTHQGQQPQSYASTSHPHRSSFGSSPSTASAPASQHVYARQPRRIYTDDSDMVFAALHAGRVTWSGMQRARRAGLDLKVVLCIVREGEGGRYVSGPPASVTAGSGGSGNSVDVGLDDALRASGEAGKEKDRDTYSAEGDIDMEWLVSSAWGNGHDGSGFVILGAEWIPVRFFL